jgi:hypothetical protein
MSRILTINYISVNVDGWRDMDGDMDGEIWMERYGWRDMDGDMDGEIDTSWDEAR